jgi:hypothetical protein
MSLSELTAAILAARGSLQDEPERSRLARAVVRASVEVERTMAESRFIVHLADSGVLVARNVELAGYASRLGQIADQIANEDPLAAPARVLERLREIEAPGTLLLPDTRLLRLAAAASSQAAVSSRQELYPRGMDPSRSLKLSQGALLGVRTLTIEQIRERVHSRYPDAAPLPDRPALDDLLQGAGLDLQWDPVGKDGSGCYVSRLFDLQAVSSRSESLTRNPTTPGPLPEITPDSADARQFEERLERAMKDGSFLTLLVNPKYYEAAMEDLSRRFPINLVDCEGVFLDALRDVAEKARVNWDLVLRTDAAPRQGDWDKLMLLVNRTMSVIEQRLSTGDKTTLIVYAGLLARYDHMDLLERLRDKVGRRDGIPGLWLLVPGEEQAVLDGKPIPIISSGQCARIPESWLKNLHRG